MSINAKTSINETQKLATLCKVWGLLKCYHPGVASGKLDWDKELINQIPKIKSSTTKAEFNSIINDLVSLADNTKRIKKKKSKTEIKYEVDFCWIQDTTIISNTISKKLEYVIENFNPQRNHYFKKDIFIGKIKFVNEARYKSYYPVEEIRILALFRYWNSINYFCPNKNIMDKSWDSVLIEFIPKFINCSDSISYLNTVLELNTNINDGHTSYFTTSSRLLNKDYSLPFSVKYIDGNTVIDQILSDTIKSVKVGDIITKFNGENINEYRKSLIKYMGASNNAGLQKYIDWFIPIGLLNEKVSIEINNDTNKLVYLRNIIFDSLYFLQKTKKSQMIDGKYLFINLHELENRKKIKRAIDSIRFAKGIILDLRNGAPDIENYLYRKISCNERTVFIKLKGPRKNIPGAFMSNDNKLRGGNHCYDIKIVILVDENTQSHTEWVCMKFQTLKNSITVGSQTAGADGNMSFIYLPGGIITGFSGLGVLYPDGTQAQRKGNKIDIEAKQTIKGIKAGKDEVLDRAIEYINTGK